MRKANIEENTTAQPKRLVRNTDVNGWGGHKVTIKLLVSIELCWV